MYTFPPVRHSPGEDTIGGENPAMEELRHARHNLLGKLNSIKMCVCALETMTPLEAVEFLEMIEGATDRAIAAMDEFDEAYDRDPTAALEYISRR
jgi:hypothetical protein